MSTSTTKINAKTPYWIKQRCNPQIGTYHIAQGQRPVKDVRADEKGGSLYGSNVYLRFDSKEAYEAKIEALKAAGEKIR